MLSTISDFHAASQVPDAAAASNTRAVEPGARPNMLQQSVGQRGQGVVVQAVRSSPEECNSPSPSYSPGIFSRLCSSLCCIRPVSELRISAAPSLPPYLRSAPHNNPALVVPMTGAGESSRVQLLSAWPKRMDKLIHVDVENYVGYLKYYDESESCIYLNGEQYELRDYKDYMSATNLNRPSLKVLPLYRERLNHQWHSRTFGSLHVFNAEELMFIQNSKIADSERFSYMEVNDAFHQFLGTQKIYHAICPDGSVMPSQLRVIELCGELVPVRILVNDGRYEAYRRDLPTQMLAVEWDGERWVPERYGIEIRAMILGMIMPDIIVDEGGEIYRYQITFDLGNR